MILLGVDFGFKRIGLALTDSEVGLPQPLQPIAAAGALKKDANVISELAKKHKAQEIVVGLPIDPEGEEGRMAKVCRQLGGHLEGHGFNVHFVDESMSSATSEAQMIGAGMKGSVIKRRLDSEAAAVILERYLRGA
ncbi:Holliday junction resolvase RuvX [soil metagenome]